MLPSQRGCVNLQADTRLWLAAHGSRVIPADFNGAVFILCGRNVSPGKTLRCLQSLCAMAPVAALPWRAIIVDDNSHDELSAFYRLVTARDRRFVLLQTDARRRMLANLVACIRHVVLSPVAIIVTLDLDDALLGTSVLEHVHHLFVTDGVEAAAGGMLNAGPHKTECTTLAVDFSAPRTRRGGRVWAHLRCFRKYLFDAILDRDLRDAQGRYFCYATDWAYMLPIVEMAHRTAALPTHCYFYQPSDRQDREDIISEIVAKPAYARRRLRVAVVGDAGKYAHPDTIAFAEQLGAALAIEGHVLLCGGEGGVMAAVCRGAKTVPNSTTVGILRTADDNSGNPWLDVVLPIGLGEARNAVLATAAHVVVAVGGGAGTLSEIAHGWTAGRMIIACSSLAGWSSKIGVGALDQRPRHTGWAAGTSVHPATTPADVVRLLRAAGSGLLRASLCKA